MSVATICWGLVAWLGAQIPQVAPPPAKSGNKPPAPAAFQSTWSLSLESIEQPFIVSGPTNFFLASKNAPLSARTLDDGHEVWQLALQTELAPAASEDLLFVATDEVVSAVDQSTGQQRWTARTGPLAIAPLWRAGWVFIAGSDGTIAGLRAEDGSRVWEQKLGSPVSAPPAIDGNRLFAPLSDGRLVALMIIPEGRILWTSEIGSAGTEPLATGERVYLGSADGFVYSIRQENGRGDWPPHALIRAKVSGHPLVHGSNVLIATLDNHVLALDRGTGAIRWRQSLTDRPGRQISIDSEQLLVPLHSGDVSVLPVKTGQPVTPMVTKLAPGNSLVPPLLMIGAPGVPQLLRLTLGSDAVLTLVSFKRAVPPPPVAKDIEN